MNDNDLMPFGAHKGTKMANVPAKTLLWYYNNFRSWGLEQLGVKKYIEENLDVLQSQVDYENKKGK